MNAQQARRRREAAQARQADLQTGPPPWGVDTAGPNQRLQAIGLPPLSPMEGTVLAPHQELVVALGTAAQLPSPVPSGYRFPPGL